MSRFTIAADRQQTVPGLMIPFSAGIQTPLSNLGSKARILYRFLDMGWTPVKTRPRRTSTFMVWPGSGERPRDLRLLLGVRDAHAHPLRSGRDHRSGHGVAPVAAVRLQAVYTSNLLDGVADPQKVVSPRADGYIVDPGNVFSVAGTTTQFMPFPMNQNLDPARKT
ncbi:MAG: hypothetical protein R3F17_11140 [Planctomycetota bacterium]